MVPEERRAPSMHPVERRAPSMARLRGSRARLGDTYGGLRRPKTSLLPGGAVIGEALTSAMEDEHLDFADRGHGRLARLVGQQAASLEHGLVQAGPVV